MAAPRFKLGSASETAAGHVAALGEVSCCCEVVESSGGVTAPRLGTCSRVVPGSACSLLVPHRSSPADGGQRETGDPSRCPSAVCLHLVGGEEARASEARLKA